MRRGLVFSITAIAGTFCGAVFAEPMPSASLDEAARSPHVVLASYQGHEPTTGRSSEDLYFLGLTATYKLESVLKQDRAKDAGPVLEPGKKLNVRYIVHDLSPCEVDESFRFSESLMPSKGSKWILFLTAKDSKHDWQTYRGSKGRMEASESNIEKVKAMLSKSKS